MNYVWFHLNVIFYRHINYLLFFLYNSKSFFFWYYNPDQWIALPIYFRENQSSLRFPAVIRNTESKKKAKWKIHKFIINSFQYFNWSKIKRSRWKLSLSIKNFLSSNLLKIHQKINESVNLIKLTTFQNNFLYKRRNSLQLKWKNIT